MMFYFLLGAVLGCTPKVDTAESVDSVVTEESPIHWDECSYRIGEHICNVSLPDSNMEDFIDEKVILCRLVGDEILCVAPATLAARLAEALSHDFGQCAHALELTSGLAGIGIAGPEATRLLSMISKLNTSVSAFSNLRCAQSKFADIHGVILRNDIGSLLGYQLYFGREFGEYLWETILEAAGVCGGGPVGFEALDAIAGQDASAA